MREIPTCHLARCCAPPFSKAIWIAFAVWLWPHALAEEAPPATENIEAGTQAARLSFDRATELPAGAFSIRHEDGDLYFEGNVRLTPTLTLTFDGNGARFLEVNVAAKATVTDEAEIGNALALGYRLARQHLDYPQLCIAAIAAVFDAGEGRKNEWGRIVVPPTARRLDRLEVTWAGDENLPLRKKLIWRGNEIAQSPEVFLRVRGGERSSAYPARLRVTQPNVVLEAEVEPEDVKVRWTDAPGLHSPTELALLPVSLAEAPMPPPDFPWEGDDLKPPALPVRVPPIYDFEVRLRVEINGQPRVARFLVQGPEQGSFEQRRRYFGYSPYLASPGGAVHP